MNQSSRLLLLAAFATFATFVAGGCSSSAPKHHVVLTNDLSVEVFLAWGLAPDDTVAMNHAYTPDATVYGEILEPGQTLQEGMSPPGHYRWYFDYTQPTYSFFHDPGVFDITDGNSDIKLSAGGTSTGTPLVGVSGAAGDDGGASGDDDGGSGDDTACTPTGGACTRTDDTCCNGDCGRTTTNVCP